MNIGIYAITNIVNKKIYIGSSNNIKQRFSWHKTALKNGYHKNDHLQLAWNKYGENNFSFIILELCDEELLIDKEIFWIKHYNSDDRNFGYNIVDPQNITISQEGRRKLSIKMTGNKNALGCKRSKAFKENLSAIKIGTKMKDSTKKKLKHTFFKKGQIPWNKGIPCSSETKEKIALKASGRITSDATKLKISKASKKAWERRKRKIKHGK